jgi:hypothetical protein
MGTTLASNDSGLYAQPSMVSFSSSEADEFISIRTTNRTLNVFKFKQFFFAHRFRTLMLGH